MSQCPNLTNLTQNFDFGQGTVKYQHPLWFVGPMAFVLAVVSIASVVGNGLVVATIARHRGMRTRTNLLLANLAAADILVGALDMPFSLVALIKGDWSFGVYACQFNAFTTGLALMASIHTLMFISIHKYISMTRPFSRAMTPLRISLMACSVWAWSCVYNLFPFFGMTSNVYKMGATQCGPIFPCTTSQKIHSYLNTFMNFLVPLVVMSFCNLKISRAVRAHMSRMRQTSNMNYRNTVLQQKHITVTLIIVMVCFLVCWSPYIIYSCLLVVTKNKESVPLILNPIVYWCGYLNSACNPIIYAFRSPSFRQGYLEILCRSQGDNRAGGSFYSGSSIKPYNRNHSDRIHAPNFNKNRVERGAPWGQGRNRIGKLRKEATHSSQGSRLSNVHHQLLPHSEAASRAVLQRMARRSVAQGSIFAFYSSRSNPELRSQKYGQGYEQQQCLRRCDTDSCLAVVRDSHLDVDTRVCSFHTIPDENAIQVIITSADGNESMSCLRTDSAYVIAIEGDPSLETNAAGVQVIVTDPDDVIEDVNSNNKVPLRLINSLNVTDDKNRGVLSLQDVSTCGAANVTEDRQRARRHTEAVNSYLPAPSISADHKFYSDPGGLAPTRSKTVEKRKKQPHEDQQPHSNTPMLANIAPKWRLSIEALDANINASNKATGLRGSILALLGKKGQSVAS